MICSAESLLCTVLYCTVFKSVRKSNAVNFKNSAVLYITVFTLAVLYLPNCTVQYSRRIWTCTV